LQVKLADGTAATYAELQPFRQFAWLLTADQATALKQLVETAAAGKADSSASSAVAQPKKKLKKAKDDTSAMVSKLFE
jgi:hypothetical protein